MVKRTEMEMALELRHYMLKARANWKSRMEMANETKGAVSRDNRLAEHEWRGREYAYEHALCILGFEPMTATDWKPE